MSLSFNNLISDSGHFENSFEADALTIVGSMNGPLDDYVREMAESLKERRPQQDKLVVLVTSLGGYIVAYRPANR